MSETYRTENQIINNVQLLFNQTPLHRRAVSELWEAQGKTCHNTKYEALNIKFHLDDITSSHYIKRNILLPFSFQSNICIPFSPWIILLDIIVNHLSYILVVKI